MAIDCRPKACYTPTMSDNLPARLTEQEILAPFMDGTPMQKLLGRTLDELGGLDFVVGWAEENPSDFMRLVMAANPPPQQSSHGGNGGVHIHMPPGLGPGPLDITPVSEQ